MSILDDLNYGLAAFGVQLPARINVDDWAATLADKPFQNTISLVTSCSVAFYLAERGHNPRVRDIYDAAVYCATCLNVGYADIFARTPVGKLIGSFLMMIGPSLATKTTDGRRDASTAAIQEQILATLKQIAETTAPAAQPER